MVYYRNKDVVRLQLSGQFNVEIGETIAFSGASFLLASVLADEHSKMLVFLFLLLWGP